MNNPAIRWRPGFQEIRLEMFTYFEVAAFVITPI